VKLIRNNWDLVRLALLSALVAIALVAPHSEPLTHGRPAFWERVVADLLMWFLLWPFLRWAVLKFEERAS
jgi:hypothetical protein